MAEPSELKIINETEFPVTCTVEVEGNAVTVTIIKDRRSGGDYSDSAKHSVIPEI